MSLVNRVILAVVVAVVLIGCQSGDVDIDKEPPSPPSPPAETFRFVPPPSDILAIRGEVLAVRAAAREGETVKGARIPFDALRNLPDVEFDSVRLVQYTRDEFKPVGFEQDGDVVIADLIAGQTYLLIPNIQGRLFDNYGILCRIRVIPGLQRVLIDRLCQQILCGPDMIPMERLYEQDAELARYREQIGGEQIPVGGWGGVPGGPGGPCDYCFNVDGGFLIIDDCPRGGGSSDPRARVINIIPAAESAETFQDSEAFLSVDRIDDTRIAATAFTPSRSTDPNAVVVEDRQAPIYVSQDQGETWALNAIVPSQSFAFPGGGLAPGQGDITVGAGDEADELYAGILRFPGQFNYRGLQTDDFFAAGTMTQIDNRNTTDQPFVQTIGAAPEERVFIANNDLNLFNDGTGPNGRTATINISPDGGATFNAVRLEPRGTGSAGQNGPSVRTSAFGDRVYAAYFGWRSLDAVLVVNARFQLTTDIVVARDDSRGVGANPFTDLVDTSDNLSGLIVTGGRTIIFDLRGIIGQQRIGSFLSVAIDPSDTDRVYVAWCDQTDNSDSTLHIRRSDDSGATWTGDLRTITNVVAPALAVASNGTVGVLYQRLQGEDANSRWVTKFEQSVALFGLGRSALAVLATVPANAPVPVFQPYLGDYTGLTTVGLEFRGIFSANNTPDLGNFPHGVVYQRSANFDTQQLFDDDGNEVNVSIDPFFFRIDAIAP